MSSAGGLLVTAVSANGRSGAAAGLCADSTAVRRLGTAECSLCASPARAAASADSANANAAGADSANANAAGADSANANAAVAAAAVGDEDGARASP
eukprot:349686-Chlamydomonas_euryale.AAC.3